MSRKLFINTIFCNPLPGQTIDEAVAALIKLAKKEHCRCDMLFNGTKVIATQHSSKRVLVEQYWADRES